MTNPILKALPRHPFRGTWEDWYWEGFWSGVGWGFSIATFIAVATCLFFYYRA